MVGDERVVGGISVNVGNVSDIIVGIGIEGVVMLKSGRGMIVAKETMAEIKAEVALMSRLGTEITGSSSRTDVEGDVVLA